MPVTNLRSPRAVQWIPPFSSSTHKVTIEDNSGTEIDVTDLLVTCEVKDLVTSGIGSFECVIMNGLQEYTSKFSPMAKFRLYMDYASSATTLRFLGRVEKPSPQNSFVKLTGRSEALFVFEKTINEEFSGVDVGQVIKTLFDTYGENRYDTSSLNTSTGVTISQNFYGVAFWDAIEKVCTAAGYDCYVPPDLVVRFYERGSVDNATDAITDEYNLLNVGEFGSDTQEVKNRFLIYGANVDGAQVVYTANDAASQAKYGVRESPPISNPNIFTISEAKEYADYLIEESRNPPVTGNVRATLLATIRPGERLAISAPLDGLQANKYRVVELTHRIDNQGGAFETEVVVNRRLPETNQYLRKQTNVNRETVETAPNRFGLDYSAPESFGSDSGTHSSTTISNGTLKVSSGSTAGTWTSDAYSTATGLQATKISLRIGGSNTQYLRFDVSANNGSTWQPIENKIELTPTTSIGNQLRLRVSFTSADAELTGFTIYYNT